MMETLSINWMYFTGIRDGKITALFFDCEKNYNLRKGDLFRIFYNKDHEVKMYFDSAKVISFREVDDRLAKKAGFATKELLSSHLIKEYNLSDFHFGVEDHLRDKLFYVITFVDDPSKIFYDNGENKSNVAYIDNIKSLIPRKEQLEYCSNIDKCSYINEMYNPEYDN